METKRDQVIKFLEDGRYDEALRIAKNFTRDFKSKEDQKTVVRAHEIVNFNKVNFYKSLGFNTEKVVGAAIQILVNIYLRKITNSSN